MLCNFNNNNIIILHLLRVLAKEFISMTPIVTFDRASGNKVDVATKIEVTMYAGSRHHITPESVMGS